MSFVCILSVFQSFLDISVDANSHICCTTVLLTTRVKHECILFMFYTLNPSDPAQTVFTVSVFVDFSAVASLHSGLDPEG